MTVLAAPPHQAVLRNCGHGLAVSCTCLVSPGGRCRELIERRPGAFPAAEAVAAWRAWHEREGIRL